MQTSINQVKTLILSYENNQQNKGDLYNNIKIQNKYELNCNILPLGLEIRITKFLLDNSGNAVSENKNTKNKKKSPNYKK